MNRTRFRKSASSARRRDPRKGRPMTWPAPPEALEARKLMAFTDVSQLAATLGRHAGPTNLYLNFDGGTVPIDPINNPGGSSYAIRSFESESGDAGLNRQRDIQDLLVQVAEVYAPFDVQVHRIYGAGNYGTDPGDTTVFVGGNLKNETRGGTGLLSTTTKYSYAETDAPSADAPRVGHGINSDAYDVAFVDPVVGKIGAAVISPGFYTERGADNAHVNIFDIKRSIAHEAGHTLGLSHVRTDGGSDPTPLGSGRVNDVMSYDSSNQYFANQSLNLTTANNSGTSTTFAGTLPSYLDTTNVIRVGPFGIPVTVPVVRNLVTQNAYKTLVSVLGVRPTDSYANVADASAVDNGAYHALDAIGVGPGSAPKVDLTGKSLQYGFLGRLGDDHVFKFTPSTGGIFHQVITVSPILGGLRAELLLYDASGQNLVAFAAPDAGGAAALAIPNGASYQVVVASQDGNSTGSYYVAISTVPAISIIHAAGQAPAAIVPLITSTPDPGFPAPAGPAGAGRPRLAIA